MTDRYVVVGRSDHPHIRSKVLLIDSMFAAQAAQSMEEGSIERRFDDYERAGHKSRAVDQQIHLAARVLRMRPNATKGAAGSFLLGCIT